MALFWGRWGGAINTLVAAAILGGFVFIADASSTARDNKTEIAHMRQQVGGLASQQRVTASATQTTKTDVEVIKSDIRHIKETQDRILDAVTTKPGK